MARRHLALIVALVSIVLPDAQAHHSPTVFDLSRTIEIRGTLLDFKLRNPHSSFVMEGEVFVDGVSGGANIARWEIESDATAIMRTSGIDADTFKPGDRVTIVAWPHRDAAFRFALARSLTAADGKEFLFRFRGSNRIFSPSLQRLLNVQMAAPEAPAPRSVGVARIVGRWQPPVTPRGNASALPLNDRGIAAWRSYDPRKSPANDCEPVSVPELFNAPFFLFNIELDSERVVLRYEAYDIVRTVGLVGEGPADPQGRFGIIGGRIENEALVVESRGYPPSGWGLGIATQILGGGADVPSSEEKSVLERYSIGEDDRSLILEYTVNDPVYLLEPYTGRVEFTRVPDDTPMYPYNCDLESAAMWSRTAESAPLRVEDK